MIRARFELEAYDPNGDDVRVHVSIDSTLDAQYVQRAAQQALDAGLRGVGAITEPGPVECDAEHVSGQLCDVCGVMRGRTHDPVWARLAAQHGQPL